MYKAVALIVILAAGITLYTKYDHKITSLNSKTYANEAVMDLKLPKNEVLEASQESMKIKSADKTLVLEEGNTLVFRGPVTEASVSQLQLKANAMSLKLKKSDKIFLVLDTPGGSVTAGMNLIDTLRALPQKVETATLFAASMGFQIVQNMDTRYITPSGTLMSHRASGGVRGQFDGELETRYRMIMRKINYLDAIASKRMGMSVKEYKKMIKDEYWVSGFDAEQEKAADEMISLRCGKSLTGTENMTVNTLFGPVELVLSRCPLIRGILSYSFKKVSKEHKTKAENAIFKAFNKKETYVREFILTDEHYTIFP